LQQRGLHRYSQSHAHLPLPDRFEGNTNLTFQASQ
jgi:hypothetical protein